MALKEQNKKYQGLPDYKKCQFFTPEKTSEDMINMVGYNDCKIDSLFLECSCGTGAILCKAVEAFILKYRSLLSTEELKKRLENQFVGYEIDEEKISLCRLNLNAIVLKYALPEIKWNLRCEDFLDDNNLPDFDYIVGNPPYVSYINLSRETREKLKKRFITCANGKFDYCFPFIEKCLMHLNPSGKLIFITPESIFKTASASVLRGLMLPKLEIVDASLRNNVFKTARVTPSIFYINNAFAGDCFKYINKKKEIVYVNKTDISTDKKWLFSLSLSKGSARFGDYFNVSNSVATLSNDLFLLKKGTFENDYFVTDEGEKVEKRIVKLAVSPSMKRRRVSAYILFPYNDDGTSFNEEHLKKHYPFAYLYLKRRQDQLTDRDRDLNALWFQYGRSQSLKLAAVEKYCLSIFVTGEPSLWYCNSGSVVFSGIVISEKDGGLPLSLVPRVLLSDSFKEYVESAGVPSSGRSWRITSTDLKEYCFDAKSYIS